VVFPGATCSGRPRHLAPAPAGGRLGVPEPQAEQRRHRRPRVREERDADRHLDEGVRSFSTGIDWHRLASIGNIYVKQSGARRNDSTGLVCRTMPAAAYGVPKYSGIVCVSSLRQAAVAAPPISAPPNRASQGRAAAARSGRASQLKAQAFGCRFAQAASACASSSAAGMLSRSLRASSSGHTSASLLSLLQRALRC
jgi:hypothetical protein